jgi:hypothetical protein
MTQPGLPLTSPTETELSTLGNMLLKRVRTLLRFGIDLGWLRDDPTTRVKSYRSNELHTWTEEEIVRRDGLQGLSSV